MSLGTFWAHTTLRLYRGVGSMIYPFTGPFFRIRANKGKEDRARRGERYGYASVERPSGPLVWLHAASVGESLAIMPLIKRMESFGINLVLTTGTVTSASVASERISERTIHQYVPLDVQRSIRRFLNHWQPDLAIFAESEIWPTTMQELSARNVPQVLVNARMSDRSNRRWNKRPALAETVFSHLTLVIAQSELDGERFQALGAPHVTVAGNLKMDVGVPIADETEIHTIRHAIGNRPVWMAVSTHAGEEEAVATVHRMVASRRPDLLTVLVPRHPDRADEVRGELKRHGLKVVTRSSRKPITAQTQVFLGDTIGEMGLYLRLGEIAFMGKSLKAEGGQNPIEPTMTGAAILSGRYVQNFRTVYQQLLDAGGARLVSDEPMLAAMIVHLLDNPAETNAMREAAKGVVATMTGALEKTITRLDPHILPLRVQAGLERWSNAADRQMPDQSMIDAEPAAEPERPEEKQQGPMF